MKKEEYENLKKVVLDIGVALIQSKIAVLGRSRKQKKARKKKRE